MTEMVIALALPEGLARASEQQVGSFGRGRFERAEKFRCAHMRGEEERDVIGHDHPRVQLVMSNFDAVFHRSKNQLSNARLSEEGRATPGLIE